MTFEEVSVFAETYGLLYLVGLFAIAVAYALWPKNKQKFDRAARLPLEED